LTGHRFAVWGLAFKPHTDDVRESPAIEIVKALVEYGAQVRVYDPKAQETAKQALKGLNVEYSLTPYGACRDADALLIATEWPECRNPDYEKLKNALISPIIFDGRNVCDLEKIKKHKFTYYGIGRTA